MNSQLVREESSCLKQTRRLRQSEGGYILLAATAIVAVLLGTGLAFMRWSTDESMQSHHVSAAIEAYYLGQMGVVEQGYQWLRNLDEGDLPISEVVMSGRTVPGYGRYADVTVMPILRGSEGDFWTQTKWYRISAVGIVSLPWYNDGRTDPKEVMRRAVLYVKVRNFADYMYLSQYEMTSFGDRIKFWHEDTLDGRVHSNSQIAIMENPVFYDQVTQAGNEDDFWHGNGYNPIFRGPEPIFHAVPVLIPEYAENLRAHATHYYSPGVNKQMRCLIYQSSITLWTWDLGEAFDSTDAGTTREDIAITGEVGLFTETPLELSGTEIMGKITIGSGQLIRLIDDVRVAGPFSMGPPEYRVAENNPNYVGIVSEGDIKIANTVANGRENSSGGGLNQPNQAFTDIVITAAVVSLGKQSTLFDGSFTFENQNDPDSGYVCNCIPDDRGWIYLWGSLTQKRRGYVHRSTNQSTGYGKQYRYDKRFLRERPPFFFNAVDSTGHALFDIVQWGQGSPQPNVPLVRYN